MKNPYAGLPSERFWRDAVASLPPFAIDPVPRIPFAITPDEKLATAGSCFAQHLSAAIAKRGFSYYIAEPAPPGTAAEAAARRNFGTYSARYGNIYTTRQLLQLFQRAYGEFTPADSAWVREDGRFVDPFRPQIQPEGFEDEAEVMADRKKHLDVVCQMLENLDVLFFTLGLTEGWMSRVDGAAFPSAPGVAGGAWDPHRYEFFNQSAGEVSADLIAFIRNLRRVNPTARVILSVSPVPMIATYEDRHVLVSNTYTKSALRVACDEAVRALDNVHYFPSYEIVINPAVLGRYYADNLRAITPAGVERVTRLFFQHYCGEAYGSRKVITPAHARALEEEIRAGLQIVCDEEAIESAR